MEDFLFGCAWKCMRFEIVSFELSICLIQKLSPKWIKFFTVDQWVDLLFFCVWKYVCLFFSLVCWVHICRSKSNSFHSIVDSYITICCHICMINDIFSPTYLVSLWFTFCLHFQFKSCLFSLSLVYILFAFSIQIKI